MALSVILNTFVMVFFVFNYLNWKLVLLILVNCWPSLFPLSFYNVIVCPFVLFILGIELSVFFLFTVSEYILGIFKKLFNNISVTLWLAVLLVLHMMS